MFFRDVPVPTYLINTLVSHVLMLVFLVLAARHLKCNIMFLN